MLILGLSLDGDILFETLGSGGNLAALEGGVLILGCRYVPLLNLGAANGLSTVF